MSMIVISVGTSLIGNNASQIAAYSCFREKLDAFCIPPRDESNEAGKNRKEFLLQMRDLDISLDEGGRLGSIRPKELGYKTENAIHQFTREFFEEYLNDEAVTKNINRRQRGDTDALPAEISSLFLYYFKPEVLPEIQLRPEFGGRGSDEKDSVILLSTDTADAIYCAKVIQVMIQKIPLFSRMCTVEEIKIIENLDVYAPEKWANASCNQEDLDEDKGLTNLYYFFRGRFLNQPGDKVLIRTGSYKEFSADLKLMAMQFGFKSLYLFEKSTQFIQTRVQGWPRGGVWDILRLTCGRPN